MEKKTVSIITVIASTLLCGLPGLIGICMSLMAVLGAFLPDSGIPRDELPILVGASATILGLSLMCIIIPVGVGFWAWWSQKKEVLSMEGILVPDDDF